MRRFIKPYSILLYLLVVISFFFIGVSYAGFIDAGKNQGLAAGAIVIGYGLISAFTAFIASLFLAYFLEPNLIKAINKILGLVIIGFITYFTWNYYTNVKPKREQQKKESHNRAKPLTLNAIPILSGIGIT